MVLKVKIHTTLLTPGLYTLIIFDIFGSKIVSALFADNFILNFGMKLLFLKCKKSNFSEIL